MPPMVLRLPSFFLPLPTHGLTSAFAPSTSSSSGSAAETTPSSTRSEAEYLLAKVIMSRSTLRETLARMSSVKPVL